MDGSERLDDGRLDDSGLSFDLVFRTGTIGDWESSRLNPVNATWVFRAFGDALKGLEIRFWEKTRPWTRPGPWRWFGPIGSVSVGPAGAREGVAIDDLARTSDTEYALEFVCPRDAGAPAPFVTVYVPPFPVVAYSRRGGQ